MQTFDPKVDSVDVASENTYRGSDGSMEKSGYESSTTNVGSARWWTLHPHLNQIFTVDSDGEAFWILSDIQS